MEQSLVIPLANSLRQFPLLIPSFPRVPLTYLESLLLCGVIPSTLVQVARKLTSPSPFPPHSNFPTPRGFPKSIVRSTKMTSRSWLHIVRNTHKAAAPTYRFSKDRDKDYDRTKTVTVGRMTTSQA